MAPAKTFDRSAYSVEALDSKTSAELVVRHHYLHRKPPISYSYGLFIGSRIVGVVTFGTPASRHLQKSVCPARPDCVIELNRLWCHDDCPRNSESYFVSNCLAVLPPLLVVSYADTAHGHTGIVYQALNFNYAGWTDMERKTPRFDYIAPEGRHTRDSFRGGQAQWVDRIRRKPKAKYWLATGDRRERRRLDSLCGWPKLDWHEYPVPTEHVHLRLGDG